AFGTRRRRPGHDGSKEVEHLVFFAQPSDKQAKQVSVDGPTYGGGSVELPLELRLRDPEDFRRDICRNRGRRRILVDEGVLADAVAWNLSRDADSGHARFVLRQKHFELAADHHEEVGDLLALFDDDLPHVEFDRGAASPKGLEASGSELPEQLAL